MDCPIFRFMKSGFCLDSDCHYFYPKKDKDEYCKYSEMTQKRKKNNEAARKQREIYKKLLKDVPAEKLKERKEKNVMCEG